MTTLDEEDLHELAINGSEKTQLEILKHKAVAGVTDINGEDIERALRKSQKP